MSFFFGVLSLLRKSECFVAPRTSRLPLVIGYQPSADGWHCTRGLEAARLVARSVDAYVLMGCTCVQDMPLRGFTPVNSSAGLPPSDSTCGRSRRAT